ncbi:hypothetical protein [Mangrovihabitans endophyticus]|uniref:Uncharacterized protein n=1 Tax=Mangrovihabitans endophyticus TaxID=1751298 RepID=A0A8J3C2U1_9ACTN|nr:hypothetical protein [Mangrovihabitans endophyticus]GGL10505.1 hypothetical protein GCM10012284_51620 [Mangrovihabitans endophyticus]
MNAGPATHGPREHPLSFRVLAVLPIILFLPSIVAFAVAEPGVVWPEYPGVFFHLAILVLIARIDAPPWAKAAGYSWITLDVLTGIMSIYGVAYDLTWPVRLGGHVFAGVWILTSSLCARNRAIAVVGAITGVWLGAYSFIADVAPVQILYPSAPLVIVWLALLAAYYRPGDHKAVPLPREVVDGAGSQGPAFRWGR